MAFELVMPKMGESVQEATITKWFVKENDTVEEEDTLLEIATDKVDSEIPSPVDGTIKEILYKEGDKVAVGEVIAYLATEEEDEEESETGAAQQKEAPKETAAEETASSGTEKAATETAAATTAGATDFEKSNRFYSPLVKNIAKKENISIEELERIEGTGQNGRVKKDDVLNYLKAREEGKVEAPKQEQPAAAQATGATGGGTQAATPAQEYVVKPSIGAEDTVKEMDRVRQLIGDHMVMSKRVSPHVSNLIEADVTNIVLWRDKVKDTYQERENEKFTFMPVFIEATAKALKDFPGVNVSVDGKNMILHKRINIGIAVAQPNGNLIVPVIKDADQRNLHGLSKEMNRLAKAGRDNKLKPDEIEGGTFSISNFGSFKNLTGTPIINQPEAAILATGTIEKKPAVVETPTGDIIAVRHKMFLSLTYDHRVIDGALGGAFLKRLAEYLEGFDTNRSLM